MPMKQEMHVITGMQRDLTVSKFSPQYAYENMNIRITARENNTLLSVSNEKGTGEVPIPSYRISNKITVEPTGKIVAEYVTASEIRGGILTVDSLGVEYRYEVVLSEGVKENTYYEGDIPSTQSIKGFYFMTSDAVYDSTYQYYSDIHALGFIPNGELAGVPLGSCVIGDYIVIFTKDTTTDIDYIYRLQKMNGHFDLIILYQGDLNFNAAYPIQTLGTYENENIQKVYWVDGLNQPRVINIVGDLGSYRGEDKFDFIRGFNTSAVTSIEKVPSGTGIFPSGVVQYALTYYNSYAQESTVFYISPLFYTSPTGRGGAPDEIVSNEFKILVQNPDNNFDGVNIYSIIRTSLNATPTVKRVASVELKDRYSVFNKTKLNELYTYSIYVSDPSIVDVFKSGSKAPLTDYPTIENGNEIKWSINVPDGSGIIINKAYDSTHPIYFLDFAEAAGGIANITYDTFTHKMTFERRSTDYGYVFVYVADISSSNYVEYNDNNTTGETVDPTELLYKGGEEVVPYTIAQKDNTLFLGNLTIKRSSIPQDLRLGIGDLSLSTEGKDVSELKSDIVDVYPYKSNLNFNNGVITSFKQGETYRNGLIFLHKTGKWSEAIPVADFEVDRYITAESYNKIVGTIPSNLLERLYNLGYIAAKPVVVFPSYADRTVLCQAVINPTLYKASERPDNSTYALSSWFFRPNYIGLDLIDQTIPVSGGSILEYRHTRPLPPNAYYNAEIQSQDCVTPHYGTNEAESSTCSNVSEGNFVIDGSICTAHSPEIEFDESVRSLIRNCQIRYMGYAKCKASYPDYSIVGPNSFLKTTRSANSNYRIVEHDYTTPYTPFGGVNNWSGTVDQWKHTAARKLCAMPVYVDGVLTRRDVNRDDDWDVLGNDGGYGNWINAGWLVYPWHRTSSLNNDKDKYGTEGQFLERTGQYTKKILSNLHYTDTYYVNDTKLHPKGGPRFYIDGDSQATGIAEVAIFDSNEDVIIKLPQIKNATNTEQVERVYRGNYNGYHGGTSFPFIVSTLKGYYYQYVQNPNTGTPSNYVSIDAWRNPYTDERAYWGGGLPQQLPYSLGRSQSWNMLGNRWDPDGTVYPETSTTETVPIKFKSTPHAVIQFNNTTYGQQAAIPFFNYNSGDLNPAKAVPSVTNEITMYIVTSLTNANKTYRAFLKDSSSSDYQLFGKLYKYNTTTLAWEEESLVAEVGYQYKDLSTSKYYVVVKKPELAYKQYLAPVSDALWHSSNSIYGPGIILQQRIQVSGNPSYTNEGELGQYDGAYILVDFYRPSVQNRFGGTGEAAYTNNIWHPAGDTVRFINDDGSLKSTVKFEYTQGDTFFQRYDCLKTYPWSSDEKNQIVDIMSFMCETRVNIDGRYDRNRGNKNNLSMSPTNFNLLNPVYSQKNNFFTFNFTSIDLASIDKFPNTVTWTSEKVNGAIVDAWTNVNMASTMDMDGDKGEVVSLNTLNNEIFCFQEQGLSNIIFNPRVQITPSDNVPIEISNSYKVQGKRYVSNMIGCNNKWSICQTPVGIYFVDNLTIGIYLFDGQSLSTISDKLGFRQFLGANNTLDKWDPVDYRNFRTFFDGSNDDVYFINDKYCLCYSELLQQFTSFMSYEKTPLMLNYKGDFYAVNKKKLWKMNGGDYNMFFGEFKPYYITIVANQDEPFDKTFNTIEFRSDMWNGSNQLNTTFDTLDVYNEYQHGHSDLVFKHGFPSSLKRKFRIWRAIVPRANTPINGVTSNSRDRIRNTWAYVKLSKTTEDTNRMDFYDMSVSYFE